MADSKETSENNKLLLKIKELALHAHFVSLFGTLICFLGTGNLGYVFPWGFAAIVSTFVLTNAIPPYGLKVPESMQKAMDERNANLGASPAAPTKQD